MALIIPADPGLLHSCSVCGSRSVFLCKGDIIHSPFSIDVDLHYRVVCRQQHSVGLSLPSIIHKGLGTLAAGSDGTPEGACKGM